MSLWGGHVERTAGWSCCALPADKLAFFSPASHPLLLPPPSLQFTTSCERRALLCQWAGGASVMLVVVLVCSQCRHAHAPSAIWPAHCVPPLPYTRRHVTIGGPTGWMADPTASSFDPIFFLREYEHLPGWRGCLPAVWRRWLYRLWSLQCDDRLRQLHGVGVTACSADRRSPPP